MVTVPGGDDDDDVWCWRGVRKKGLYGSSPSRPTHLSTILMERNVGSVKVRGGGCGEEEEKYKIVGSLC